MKILVSPHPDDEVLFCSFTILREKPIVLIVFDSVVQEKRGTGITGAMRRKETMAAMKILGAEVRFLGYSDAHREADISEGLFPYLDAEHVWAPAVEAGGHHHHNYVGNVCVSTFGDRVTHYMTYTTAGKSTGKPVPIEPGWISKKLAALACYESQIDLPNCREHFLRAQHEYYL